MELVNFLGLVIQHQVQNNIKQFHHTQKISNMATYGQGKMLGSGINPESFKQDYSGFANAAAMQAQGIANLGQSIGGAIEDYGKIKKQQREDERSVQKSESVAKAIGDLIPELKPAIKNSLELLSNKEIPLSQRKAEADAISSILTLGIGAITNKQKMAIDLAQIEAQNRGSSATPSLQRGKKRLVIDGQIYEIDINYNPKTGVSTDDYGNVISDPFSAAGQIDSALNLPALGGDATSATINTTGVDAPSLLPMPPQTDVAGIQAAIAMPDGNAGLANVNPMPPGTPTMTTMPRVDGVPPMLSRPEPQTAVTQPPAGRQPSRVPPGAVPVGEKVEIRALTREEKVARNLPLDNEYSGRFVNGMLAANPTVIPAPEDPIATERSKAMDAPNIALFEAGQSATQRLPNIQAAYKLLESDAVKTGTLAEYKVAAKRLFNQDVSNEEQFMSLVGNLAMEAIDLTKGAISDREMTFFREQLAPSINKSVEGNKKILKFTIDKAKRDIEISKKVSELFEKKASPSEIQAEVAKIMEKNPLVTGESASTAIPTNNAPDTGLDALEAKHPSP